MPKRKHNPSQKSLKNFTQNLPIHSARETILNHLKTHSNLIIISETGSGKTTQIPQYLLKSQFVPKNTLIAITQPRRVSAITVSTRVAQEMNVILGEKVGYSIRFDDLTSDKTRIKYVTDGMLLREIMNDNLLSKYSVIVLDEVHERTMYTDILFALLKNIQKERLDLKVIAMSATLCVDDFSSYFNNAPIIRVPGRLFNVQIKYLEEPESDYLEACVISIIQIHLDYPKGGHILAFLTGQDEIESVVQILNKKLILQNPNFNKQKVKIYPLFAALPTQEQLKVFEKLPKDIRKIIISTNIAETSVTINDINFVVDCGFSKKRHFYYKKGIDILINEPITKSEALQRSGRAGRVSNGTCFRLYTEQTFQTLNDHIIPEILRTNLSQLILQINSLSLKTDISKLDLMSKPKKSALKKSFKRLYLLEAIDEHGNLSDLGHQMSVFPLDPILSKALIVSPRFNCSEEVLTIVSMLSVDNIWLTSHSLRSQVAYSRRQYSSAEGGDLFALLNIYNAFIENKSSKKWCERNFVNFRSIIKAQKIRFQLLNYFIKMGLPLVSLEKCKKETEPIRRSLSFGFFLNTAILQQDGTYQTLLNHQSVSIHPSSLLHRKKANCVMFSELVMTTKKYIRDLFVVEQKWLSEVAPRLFSSSSALFLG